MKIGYPRTALIGVACVVAGTALGPAGVNAASKAVESVFITNTAADPVPVTGSVSVSGTPSVSVAGTPSVSLAGTPSVNVAGTPTVKVDGPVQTTTAEPGERVQYTGTLVAGNSAGTGPLEDTRLIELPAGTNLLVQYVSVQTDGLSTTTPNASLFTVRENRTSDTGDSIYVPLVQSGSKASGSEQTDVLMDSPVQVKVRRDTRSSFASADYTITGRLVDAP